MIGRKLLRFSPIALVLVAGACGSGGGTKTVTVTDTVTRTVEAAQRVPARIYLVRDGKIAPVARSVRSLRQDALLEALSSGPTTAEKNAGFATAIPGGIPIPGGSQHSRLGLAQVVFTLSQAALSSPVVVGNHSYTRADFEDETPLILVESPLPFQTVHSPMRVTGTANTFEATFNYDLIGPDGKVIAHHFVTATSGSGVRGTFDFAVPFTVSQSGPGKLAVYELSAKDGSRVHQVEIPLTLEP